MAEAVGRVAVRAADGADADAVWRIFRAVVATGETYAFDPGIGRAEALAAWSADDCFVALAGDRILGTYILRANQPGLGAHVANAAFMVDPSARGRGIGRAMGEDALARAAAQGFRAMQFNLVVAENEPAIRLWESLGFTVVGRVPEAFHWRRERFVDGLVMYRTLAGAGGAATLFARSGELLPPGPRS